MTEHLAKVLAGIDNPELIAKLLKATGEENLSSTPFPPGSDGKSLHSLYEQYLSRRQNRSPGTRA